MAVRILRCSFSSSVFVRMAVFLFGVIFGMLLYLSKAQSSAEKIQQIYEEMQLEQAESLQYNLLEEQFGEQEVQQMLLDKTYECSLGK